ncbi:MAG: hypothetical protein HXL34_09475 [Prevotellaceae bacterium]|nr:hypothetical protein [Prevotellaceae bacterium]
MLQPFLCKPHRLAAVSSAYDGRHTHRPTFVSNTADGRRTVSLTPLSTYQNARRLPPFGSNLLVISM